MRTVVPDYYRDFHCKAGNCKHTCCAGWEIDIDEETYESYKRIGGSFGKKLMTSIAAEDTPHFILEGEDERCPMLGQDGLCRLISEYGEEALCQICADHPRFYNCFSDRTEIGLGLCCEAAGELILGKRDKVRLITLSDDGNSEPISVGERHLFASRDKMLDILQNRQLPVPERIKQLLAFSGLTDKRDIGQLADLFAGLERLDEKWTAILQKLPKAVSGTPTDLDDAGQTVLEQFAVYLVFRYTPYLNRKAAVLSISAVFRLYESLCYTAITENGRLDFEKAVELARLLSCEVEYSDENVDRLFGAGNDRAEADSFALRQKSNSPKETAMKVRYIGFVDDSDLTYGSIYECLGRENDFYRVIDESEEDYLYPVDEFEIVEE